MSKYFKPSETRCKCGCGFDVKPELLIVADKVREKCGFPLIVSSGARCIKHNSKVGGASKSSHKDGLALDISCTDSQKRMILIKVLLDLGVKRIGLGKNFIHFDVHPTLPQDVMFNY